VANRDSNNISAYLVNPNTGTLTEIAGSPFAVRSGPLGISIDPNTTFIRVTHENTSEIATIAIDQSTGGLLPVASDAIVRPSRGANEITTLSGTNPVAFKPKFTYVSGSLPNFGPGRIAGFTADAQNGALTLVPGSPFASGVGSASMAS